MSTNSGSDSKVVSIRGGAWTPSLSNNQETYHIDVKESEDWLPREAAFVPINRLYPIDSKLNVPFLDAKKILYTLLQDCDEAQQKFKEGDYIRSDDKIQSIQMGMSELFCFRQYSEGLGYASVAIFHALKNEGGELLEMDKISALRQSLYYFWQKPFLSFDEALDIVDVLERHEMIVEPEEISNLTELLNEQSSS